MSKNNKYYRKGKMLSVLEKISLCALKSMTEAKQIKGVLNCLLENYAEENNEAVVLINLFLKRLYLLQKKQDVIARIADDMSA